MRKAYSVSQINAYIKRMFTEDYLLQSVLVRGEVSKDGVKAEISIIISYGSNIPETSSKVQKRIKAAVESMTGLSVLDVNIRISGIAMAEQA